MIDKIPTLYELAPHIEYKLQALEFSERTARTVSLLVALDVLPTKRQILHAQLHTTTAALFVAACDAGGAFELPYTSMALQRRYGLHSGMSQIVRLMEAKGLLEATGKQQYRIIHPLTQAVQPLTEKELLNA